MKEGKMRRMPLLTLATATSIAALFAGSAFAQVANTTQKGSLLIWPLITVDQSSTAMYGGEDTFVELSNSSSYPIEVECYYVNETKDRVDFDFNISGKGTVSWDVLQHKGDNIAPPPFPTGKGKYSGDVYRGELVCFAVDDGVDTQVPWNELTGTAAVEALKYATATEAKEEFKYNAWSFCARNSSGCAPDDNTLAQGTPGDLALTGQNTAGVYDACPAVNIATFMPNGAKLGYTKTLANNLSVSGCDQDLTENYSIYTTDLSFNIWNANEDSYSGTYICTDSVETVPLSDSNTSLNDSTNFDNTTLRTPDARFEVSGISSGVCGGSYNVGLLGILHEPQALSGDKGADAIAGNTLYGMGSATGFVYWNPY